MSATRKVLLSMFVVGCVAAVAGYGTFSAFSATTTNSGNVFSAGTVVIGDNSSGGLLYNFTGQKPGSQTGCIKVTYTGSLPATVSLYTASSSGTLGQYVTLTVDKVTYVTPPAFPACGSPSGSTNVYTGVLGGAGGFTSTKTTFANGVQAFPASQTQWNQNDAVYYRFTLTLQSNNLAQGLTSTTGFTWEADNQ